jgi:hypothetical protein
VEEEVYDAASQQVGGLAGLAGHGRILPDGLRFGGEVILSGIVRIGQHKPTPKGDEKRPQADISRVRTG